MVTAVQPGSVSVEIKATSACATCQAHAHCGFAESKTKTLTIPSADWQQYAEGQTVSVGIDESHGLAAVWIAYLLPALLLIAFAAGGTLVGLPEWAVALGSIGALLLYLVVLYLRRQRLESRFRLTLSHHSPSSPIQPPTQSPSPC